MKVVKRIHQPGGIFSPCLCASVRESYTIAKHARTARGSYTVRRIPFTHRGGRVQSFQRPRWSVGITNTDQAIAKGRSDPMSRKGLIIVVATACLLLNLTSHAEAQRRERTLSRPRTSSYLDYFRYDRGGGGYLNPFRQFSSPLLRSPSQRNRQTTAGTESGELLRARARLQSQATRGSGVAPTGTGSSFNNYSHFYQMRNSRR